MIEHTENAAATETLPATAPHGAELAAVGAEAHKLIEASISANTRAAYGRALRQFDAWRRAAPECDGVLAEYFAHLDSLGRAPATASQAAAAVRFRARLAGAPDPVGPLASRALAGFRRERFDRGRGQANPLTAAGFAAIAATARRPRPRGRGMESEAVADARGVVDVAAAAVLFHAGLRRSEAAALRWGDLEDASEGRGLRVRVRRSKADQTGERADVRFVAGDAAAAVRALRALRSFDGPEELVFGGLSGASIGRRLTAAAKAAGIAQRLTAHSGRVGLASELTARGASTADVQRAGGWADPKMVAHYSAGATAERGAVARYLG